MQSLGFKMSVIEIIDYRNDKALNQVSLKWKCKQWIDCEYILNKDIIKDEDDFTLHIVSNLPKDFYKLEIDKVADMITETWKKYNQV